MNKIKGLILTGLLALTLGPRPAFAEPTYREMFRETNDAVIDFAILSAVEPGYFRDLVGGKNIAGAQLPIVYVTPYLDFDWGYITGYDEKSRGTLMLGGTLRVNKLLNDYFYGNVRWARAAVPVVDKYWSRLWFGPFVAHNFTDDKVIAGVKAGLSF